MNECICPDCNGAGTVPYSNSTCLTCKGDGIVYEDFEDDEDEGDVI